MNHCFEEIADVIREDLQQNVCRSSIVPVLIIAIRPIAKIFRDLSKHNKLCVWKLGDALVETIGWEDGTLFVHFNMSARHFLDVWRKFYLSKISENLT